MAIPRCKRCGHKLELCKTCPGPAIWICPVCIKLLPSEASK